MKLRTTWVLAPVSSAWGVDVGNAEGDGVGDGVGDGDGDADGSGDETGKDDVAS